MWAPRLSKFGAQTVTIKKSLKAQDYNYKLKKK